jgi:hypothetical protein
MAFALFLDTKQVSDCFSTKAEAWEFAERRGLVTVVPSQDEDPPRRILALKFRISRVSDVLSSNNLSDGSPSLFVDPAMTTAFLMTRPS